MVGATVLRSSAILHFQTSRFLSCLIAVSLLAATLPAKQSGEKGSISFLEFLKPYVAVLSNQLIKQAKNKYQLLSSIFLFHSHIHIFPSFKIKCKKQWPNILAQPKAAVYSQGHAAAAAFTGLRQAEDAKRALRH